jgi:ceramide glucosyltransferase
VRQVSILQPVVSGDPTLRAVLEQDLRFRTGLPIEHLYLPDADDGAGVALCEELATGHQDPGRKLHVVPLPPPGEGENPKMFKLVAGLPQTHGDVLCVLDDDTLLPDGALETCLPYLDEPGVGLAFGLPYYTSFMNFWSRLIAYFVNSHSLLTYIPYLRFSKPLTINGMFYLLRREKLEGMGGFRGLEPLLSDDFAIGMRVRQHGLRLAQTPLRHGISTYVTGPRHYFNLMQRWLIFPRESLMHYLTRREQAVFYGTALLPLFFPWLAVGCALLWPAPWTLALALVYFIYDYAIFAHLNVAYLRRASPWRHSWLVPVVKLLLPLQAVVALLSPQRIVWRGNLLQAGRGGLFTYVRRRES